MQNPDADNHAVNANPNAALCSPAQRKPAATPAAVAAAKRPPHLAALGAALLAVLLGGCHSAATRISYQGGDGSSDRQSVIIKGPGDEATGVSAEWAWVEQRYPGCHRGQRALISLGSTQYDLVALSTAEGQVRRVWFDITDFHQKL